MENTLVKDIAWLAGLLEGEGSFGFYRNCPQIQLQTTDLDVIQKAGKIIKQPKIATYVREGKAIIGIKPYHRFAIHGRNAVGWMLTIYPFMGVRRRKKIQEILLKWHALPGRTGRPIRSKP